MPSTLDVLKAQAQALTPAEQADLAEFLLAGAGLDDAAWQAEVARRVTEARSGTVTGRPVDEVIAELRERPQ